MIALEERTLIDTLLEEQRLLTAVARFAQRHENQELPEQARYYRDLIPLSAPIEGQQYAFEVDLDQCSGCKACVTACHNLNGLDENETWRAVGLLYGGTAEEPVQRFVTTACHHCVDPACLNGCPVNAYEKDAVTGIVRHLDDQCIGCQYCILKCPYDVPKYHPQKGIVRKCDMCSSRLAVGEAPACAQACPNEAIRITLVNKLQIAVGFRNKTPDSVGRDVLIAPSNQLRDGALREMSPAWNFSKTSSNSFLPAAPEPDYTLPTTKYKTRKSLPANTKASDAHKLKPEPSHPPLIFMLALTQLSVGALCIDFLVGSIVPELLTAQSRPMQVAAALAFGLFGLGASLFHLGRPLLAWRAFVGLRRSWLSREIVVFGTFALLATVYAGSFWLRSSQSLLVAQNVLGASVALVGLLGTFCSHMIYHDTRRVFWQGIRTAGKFFGTTLLLGLAFTLCMCSLLQPGPPQLVFVLGGLLVVTSITKLAWEISFLSPLKEEGLSPSKRSALLMTGALRRVAIARILCGFLGGILLPGILLGGGLSDLISHGAVALLTLGGLLFCLLGELFERYLFFAAVVAPKMPGSVTS